MGTISLVRGVARSDPTRAVYLPVDPARPSAESFLLAVQRVLADFEEHPDITNTVGSYVFLGDPLSRVNRTAVTVGAPDEPASHPRLVLAEAVPNPFNPITRIAFRTSQRGLVDLAIYDVGGRRIRTLVLDVLSSGRHEVEWRGHTSHGERVPSGVYFCRLDAQGHVLTRRVIVVE